MKKRQNRQIRRDKLLRLARAGKLVAIAGYSFQDGYGESRFKGEKPVNILEPGRHKETWREDSYNMMEWDFHSRSGSATLEDNGDIWLCVHSNSNHTLRIAGV